MVNCLYPNFSSNSCFLTVVYHRLDPRHAVPLANYSIFAEKEKLDCSDPVLWQGGRPQHYPRLTLATERQSHRPHSDKNTPGNHTTTSSDSAYRPATAIHTHNTLLLPLLYYYYCCYKPVFNSSTVCCAFILDQYDITQILTNTFPLFQYNQWNICLYISFS